MKKNKIVIYRIIFATLLICNFAIIFMFSSQDGEDSTSVSQGLIYNFLKIFMSNPVQISETILLIEPFIRKLAHFSIYALAGIWMISFLKTYNNTEKKRIIIGLTIGFLYALSDEFHQSFIGERNASIFDVLIDTLGFAFGMICVILLIKLMRNRKTLH